MRAVRTNAVLIAVILLVVQLVGISRAIAKPVTDTERVVYAVLLAQDPQAAFLSLSSADQKVFAESLKHQTTETTSQGGTLELTSAERAAMHQASPAGVSAAVATAASGCWWHYNYTDYYDLGLHTGATWMQLNWCSSNGSITSWSIPVAGGRGYTGKLDEVR